MTPDPSPRRRTARVFTPELGERICALIAAGETREAVCARPDMPSRSTLREWTQRNPEFARDYKRARAEAAAGQITFHLAKAENRRASRARRDGGRRSTYSPAMGRAVCARLIGGETPKMIGADPAMPSCSTIFYWLRARRDFQALYAQARELMAEAKLHQAWDIASSATAQTVREARLQFDVIRWQVALLAPFKYRREALEAVEARPPLTVVIRRFTLDGEPLDGDTPAQTLLPAPND